MINILAYWLYIPGIYASVLEHIHCDGYSGTVVGFTAYGLAFWTRKHCDGCSGTVAVCTGYMAIALDTQKILLTFWKHKKNRDGCSANAKIVTGILEQGLGVPYG